MYNDFCTKPWYDNIYRRIANKRVLLVIGGGLMVDSEEEAVIQELERFIERSELHTKLIKEETITSLYGRAIFMLYRLANGELDFKLMVPSMMSRVAKISEVEQAADIWAYDKQADNMGLVHITCDRTYIKVEEYGNDDLLVGEVNTEIKADARPKTNIYKHGFNRIPLIERLNQPLDNWYGYTTVWNGIPDAAPIEPMIQRVQNIHKYIGKELQVNRTRLGGAFDANKIRDYSTSSGTRELVDSDSWLSINGQTLDNNGPQGIFVQEAKPQFTSYVELLKYYEKQIFNGLTNPMDIDEYDGVNYENATKTMMNNKHDMQTQAYQRAMLISKLYIIFDIFLQDKGLYNPDVNKDRPYILKFKNATMTDKLMVDALMTSRLANGTESFTGAIQEYDGVNSLMAKQKLDKINDEFQEISEIVMERSEANSRKIKYEGSGGNGDKQVSTTHSN